MNFASPPILRMSCHRADCEPSQRVDHAAGAQEEQRLEEGVGEEVVHADGVGVADGEAGKHVAELADGRVGQHALDVVLREGDGRGKERRESADIAYDLKAAGPAETA